MRDAVRRLFAGHLLVAAMLSATPVTFSGSGGTLADSDGTTAGVISFTIVVADPRFLVAGLDNITIRLLGLDHTFASDLEVRLTHVPSGTSRTLFSGIGLPGLGAASNFGDTYSFQSGYSAGLWAAALALGDVDTIAGDSGQPPQLFFPTSAGSAAPNDFSTAFAGLAAAGTWSLTITDSALGDTGSLVGWELILNLPSNDIPEPSTGVLAAAALAALLSWRRQ